MTKVVEYRVSWQPPTMTDQHHVYGDHDQALAVLDELEAAGLNPKLEKRTVRTSDWKWEEA